MWENAFGNEEQRGEIIITPLLARGLDSMLFRELEHHSRGSDTTGKNGDTSTQRLDRLWTFKRGLWEEGKESMITGYLLGGVRNECHLHQSIYLTSFNMIMLCHSGVYLPHSH